MIKQVQLLNIIEINGATNWPNLSTAYVILEPGHVAKGSNFSQLAIMAPKRGLLRYSGVVSLPWRDRHISSQRLEKFLQASGLFGVPSRHLVPHPWAPYAPVVLKYCRLSPCNLPPGNYLGSGVLPYFLRAVLPVVTVVAGHFYQASALLHISQGRHPKPWQPPG